MEQARQKNRVDVAVACRLEATSNSQDINSRAVPLCILDRLPYQPVVLQVEMTGLQLLDAGQFQHFVGCH